MIVCDKEKELLIKSDDVMNIKVRKRWCRAEARKTLKSLKDGYRSEASGRICHTVYHMPEYKKAKTIMAYMSMDKEVMTVSLLVTMLRHEIGRAHV